jgi:hypothetical protein
MLDPDRSRLVNPNTTVEDSTIPANANGRERTLDVASLATALVDAVLDRDWKRAETIARAMRERGLAPDLRSVK